MEVGPTPPGLSFGSTGPSELTVSQPTDRGTREELATAVRIIIPTPLMSLTTRRVMLSQWVNGVKLSTLPQQDGFLLAPALGVKYEACSYCLQRSGCVFVFFFDVTAPSELLAQIKNEHLGLLRYVWNSARPKKDLEKLPICCSPFQQSFDAETCCSPIPQAADLISELTESNHTRFFHVLFSVPSTFPGRPTHGFFPLPRK